MCEPDPCVLLSQVAAHADHHICVRKTVDQNDRMVTTMQPLLTHEERRQEVAAMLGLGLAEAEQLLEAAQHE